MAESPIEMRRGAVAVVDALGFKEARKEHGVTNLVRSVQRVRRQVQRTAEYQRRFGSGEVTTAAFSDAVIIAREANEHEADAATSLAATVELIALMTSQLITTAAAGRPPLAFRGCIAAGSLAVVDDIFVGEAIDEAAQFAEEALAAMVWLAPSARAALTGADDFALLPWSIPLRSRGQLTVLAVNPFWLGAAMAPDIESAEREIRTVTLPFLLSPFDTSHAVDVVQKRQNTEAFLGYAAEQTIVNWPEIQQRTFDARQDGGDDA